VSTSILLRQGSIFSSKTKSPPPPTKNVVNFEAIFTPTWKYYFLLPLPKIISFLTQLRKKFPPLRNVGIKRYRYLPYLQFFL
jgi:hypothetical protein